MAFPPRDNSTGDNGLWVLQGKLGSKIMNRWVLWGGGIFGPKKCFGSQLHRVCLEWSGESDDAVYAPLSRFHYVRVSCDLSELVVPTLRGANGDVVTAFAYDNTKVVFLQSLALPMAGQGPCERHEITASTTNGLHVFMGSYTTCLCKFFCPRQLKKKLKCAKLVF